MFHAIIFESPVEKILPLTLLSSLLNSVLPAHRDYTVRVTDWIEMKNGGKAWMKVDNQIVSIPISCVCELVPSLPFNTLRRRSGYQS